MYSATKACLATLDVAKTINDHLEIITCCHIRKVDIHVLYRNVACDKIYATLCRIQHSIKLLNLTIICIL